MRTNWLPIGLILAAPSFGQALVVQLEPESTHIDFTLGDILHTVRGTFRLQSGELRLDPATGAASGLIVVDATSGDSDSKARDSRMHKNILESDKYPEITFAPDRVIGKLNIQGASDVELHGLFTIHGAAHELTAPVHAQIDGDRLTA